MSRTILALLTALLLTTGMATLAHAGTTVSEHYRWTDPAGVVHFSDIIPATALANGYDVVNNDGRVVRHVNRELTPEERHAAEIVAAQQATAKRAAQQRGIEDAQMLSAYPTANDLAQAQQAQLKQIELDIATLQGNLHSQEISLTDLLSHAADLEHAHKPIPPIVKTRISEQRGSVNDERGALQRRRADLAHAKATFAAQLARYRVLRGKYQHSTP